jgi:Flp pilus assembly protein TadG
MPGLKPVLLLYETGPYHNIPSFPQRGMAPHNRIQSDSEIHLQQLQESCGDNLSMTYMQTPHAARSFLRSNAGVSAVEFAIIAPVFILLVMGMIAYGIYFGAMHSMQQIAADAARTAIAGLDETERKTLATGFIDRNAGEYPFIERAKLVVDVKDNPLDSQQFVVSLQYDAHELPVWSLLPDLPLPGTTITRSSTIRVGGI